ncbi:MAG: aminotransferase class V-fold PLP-dependent enzyme [Saprospiraceae bacterium]|nr:aminotransferase class V-fold PLP-dependent enzyme [Saprospiraceae bacterium]
MRKELEYLESVSRRLDMPADDRIASLQSIIGYGEEFLKEIDDIPVYQESPESLETLQGCDFEDDGKSLDQLLAILRQAVDSTGINPAAAGHLGYVPGGGVFPSALGDYLAAVTNRYAGIYYANPGAVILENLCVQWMAKIIGYPEQHAGNLSSGGSIATLTALTAARDWHEIKPENVRNQVIYLTTQTHHCVLKALRIAALDYSHVRMVEMNTAYQMDPEDLNRKIEIDKRAGLNPFLIVASAGSTDLGIIDPLDEIASIAKREGCWFHIDAAYGGFFVLTDELSGLLSALAKSDSVVLDPHKGLFLSYGTGAVLIKNRAAAIKSHYYRANYMQDAEGDFEVLNPADISPELTKHFRGLRMWLSLQLLGIKPYKAALTEKLLLARYFHSEVQKIGFKVGPDPTLSVCLFRISGNNPESENQQNRALMNAILKTGKIFLSSTTLDGTFWLRICVMVFRTHKRNIDELLKILRDQYETYAKSGKII